MPKTIKYSLLILIYLNIISCNTESNIKDGAQPKFNISLPDSYIKEVIVDEKYRLLSADKSINDEIVAVIEIRYSDDWSFKYMDNQQLIDDIKSSNKIDSAASLMFNNFKVHSIHEVYLKGVGNCVGCIYSGDHYLNNVRVTNFTVQFIKDGKMFTLVGSTTPDLFSNYHKEFLEIFDTFTL